MRSSPCNPALIALFCLSAAPHLHAQAGVPQNRLPPSAPARRPPIPPPTGWRIARIQTGTEATLRGPTLVNGRPGAALLAIGCIPASSTTLGTLSIQLKLSKSAVPFDYGSIVMEGGSDNDFARSQLGNEPEIHIDMAADQVGDAAIAPFDLEYLHADRRKLIEATNTPLKITVWPPDKPQPQLVATFQLPADSAAMQTIARPYLEASEQRDKSEDETQAASTVLACPAVEGQALIDGKVLVGPARKELEMDPDSEGQSWNLPKATKTRPRPKLVAVCMYGAPGYTSGKRPTLSTRELPIPANATSCGHSHQTTGNLEDFRCFKNVPDPTKTPARR